MQLCLSSSADLHQLCTVADQKILKRGRRKTIYQLRPHLSQMRTTKYMPFTWKKWLFKIIIGGAPLPSPIEFATQCVVGLNLNAFLQL